MNSTSPGVAGTNASDGHLGMDRVAVVGLACHFPGARNLAELWRLLLEGREAIGECPADRPPSDELRKLAAEGRIPSSRGGFLEDVRYFDAGFFGISPREARDMDPQQKLLLEAAWHALEDAGIPVPSAAGPRSGVFVGMWSGDFENECCRDAGTPEFYQLVGGGRHSASGRLAHALDFRGPCATMDAACASSMVALHHARRAILSGECDVAVAAGVNLILSTRITEAFARSNALSSDGRSKFGDESADGFTRSEGVAVVVLKRLSHAVREGNRIYATILGSAVNNDGGTSLSFRPSVQGQKELLRAAMEDAGVRAGDIDFIEAHGTGTKAGDPVELEAIGTVMREGGRESVLPVGSIKTNIGHTEGAAGLAGFIKAVMALKTGVLPASLHLHTPNPNIPWGDLPVRVHGQQSALPDMGRPRRAGISAFGITGTNGHVIVEEYVSASQAPGAVMHGPALISLSAKTEGALREVAARYLEHTGNPGNDLPALSAATLTRRTHHSHRLALAVSSREQLQEALQAAATGEPWAGLRRGIASEEFRCAFVFPGQGSQWVGMGRQLLASEPVFRDAIGRCEEAMRPHVSWRLSEVLTRDEAMDRISVIQPVLFAFSVALAELWRSRGIEPAAVIGHSMGEVAAAVVSGALSLDDAAAVICRRSRLMEGVAARGGMALVEMASSELVPLLAAYGSALSTAAINGPASTVISGDVEPLDDLLTKLDSQGTFCRRVKVDVASHSHHVDPLLGDLLREIAHIQPASPRVPWFSTVAGRFLDGPHAGPAYWADNLRNPVLFADAVRGLLEQGITAFLELSPHPLLMTAVDSVVREAGLNVVSVPSLRRDQDEPYEFASNLAALYCAGAVPKAQGGGFVDLPLYPFERQEHWSPLPVAREQASGRGFPEPGIAVSSHADVSVWPIELGLSQLPWLEDHRVAGVVVAPAALQMTWVRQIAARVLGPGPVELERVTWERAVAVPDRDSGSDQSPAGVPVQVVFTRDSQHSGRFEIRIQEGADSWALASRGRISLADSPSLIESPPSRPNGARAGREEFYAQLLSGAALGYGPAFRAVEEATEEGAVCEVKLADAAGISPPARETVLIDGMLHPTGWMSSLTRSGPSAWVPSGVERFWFGALPDRGALQIRTLTRGEGDGTRSQIWVCCGDALIAYAAGFELHCSARGKREQDPAPLFETVWTKAEVVASKESASGEWLVATDRSGIGEQIARQLEARGNRVVLVEHGARFARLAPNRWRIRPQAAADWDRVVEGGEFTCLRGAAYCWAADAIAAETATLEFLRQDQHLTCSGLVMLAKRLAALPRMDEFRLAIVTAGVHATAEGDRVAPVQAPAYGLGRVIAREHPEYSVLQLDLSERPATYEINTASDWCVSPVGQDDQVAVRKTGSFVPRLRPWQRPGAEPRALRPGEGVVPAMGEPGLLDSFQLLARRRKVPGPGQVEIAVSATALNFRDVAVATGLLRPTAGEVFTLGLECCGRITATGEGVEGLQPGDEVVAVTSGHGESGLLGSHVLCDAFLVFPKPAGLSPDEAASAPLVFFTAWYSLHYLARIARGDRVLIHSAAGGVGLAAIQYARRAGAEIFATAGSPEKRDFLRAMGIAHVFDSRDAGFASRVHELTGGRGVDIVLNSLSGPLLLAGLETLAPYGRFIELGKRDFQEDRPVGLAAFRKNTSFFGVDLSAFLREQPARAAGMISQILEELSAGILKPLPVTSFPASETAAAFRLMASGGHKGKVAIRYESAAPAKASPDADDCNIREDATYLITGGLTGVGLLTAKFLAEHGARHLALAARRAPGEEAQAAIEELRNSGIDVRAFQADVSDAAQTGKMLEAIRGGMPPLRGVFHAAAVLDDGLIADLTPERFDSVLAPKVLGSWNLHRLTCGDPLDHFVLYSSVASLLPQPGMASYSAANAFLDALARWRRRSGHPAVSVNWGGWNGVGLAHTTGVQRASRAFELIGMDGMEPAQAFGALASILAAGSRPNVLVSPINRQKIAEALPAMPSPGFVSELAEGVTAPAPAGASLADSLRQAGTPQQKQQLLEDHLVRLLSRILRMPEANIDRRKPLGRMGLDSLMAVELVTGLGSALRMKIPATTVFNYPDVTALAAHLVSQAAGASASVVRIPKPAASPAADISEEDAIAALLGNGPAALPGGNAEPGTGEWTSAGVGASTGD